MFTFIGLITITDQCIWNKKDAIKHSGELSTFAHQ